MSTRGLKPEWYLKAKELMRCKHIDPSTPGHDLLIYAICELEEDPGMEEEELYDLLQKNYIVPIPDVTEKEKKRHPVEYHMLGALKSVGVDSKPWNFINDFINEVKVHNNEP